LGDSVWDTVNVPSSLAIRFWGAQVAFPSTKKKTNQLLFGPSDFLSLFFLTRLFTDKNVDALRSLIVLNFELSIQHFGGLFSSLRALKEEKGKKKKKRKKKKTKKNKQLLQ
jgi:hypothetical protein